jgi:hypothetical protein
MNLQVNDPGRVSGTHTFVAQVDIAFDHNQ